MYISYISYHFFVSALHDDFRGTEAPPRFVHRSTDSSTPVAKTKNSESPVFTEPQVLQWNYTALHSSTFHKYIPSLAAHNMSLYIYTHIHTQLWTFSSTSGSFNGIDPLGRGEGGSASQPSAQHPHQGMGTIRRAMWLVIHQSCVMLNNNNNKQFMTWNSIYIYLSYIFMVMIGGWCKWQGSRDVWFCLILNHWLYFLFVSTEWFDPPQTLGVSNMAGKVSTWTSFVSSQLRLLWVNNIWRPQQPYMMVRMGNHTKNDLGMGIWTAFFFTTHQISLPKTAKWIDLFLSFLTISGKGLSNSQNKKRNSPISVYHG